MNLFSKMIDKHKANMQQAYINKKNSLIARIEKGKVLTIPESITINNKQFLLDKDVWIALIKKHNTERFCPPRFMVEKLPSKMLEDADIMVEAVRCYGLNLRFGEDNVRDNENVVLVAVKNDGMALQYASKRLRADENIFLPAMDQNEDADRYIYIDRNNANRIGSILSKRAGEQEKD